MVFWFTRSQPWAPEQRRLRRRKRISRRTQTSRATYNAVCLVVSGEGRSTVGEQRFEWSKNDVFTVPHWTWASHEARGTADLLLVTDRAIFERLDLLREESK